MTTREKGAGARRAPAALLALALAALLALGWAAPAALADGGATGSELAVHYQSAEESDISNDNVAFEVPARVTFAARADGTLVAPSASETAIANKSAFGIRVSSMQATADSAWKLMARSAASATAEADAAWLEVGPEGDPLDASAYAEKKAVAIPALWNMSFQGAAEKGGELAVAYEGGLANVTGAALGRMAAEGGAKLASIQWSVTPGNADLTAATPLHASFAGGLEAVGAADSKTVAAKTGYGEAQVQLSADTLVKSGDGFTIRPGDVVTLTASAQEGFEVDPDSVAVTAQALEPSSAGAARSMSVQSVAAGEAVRLTRESAGTWKFFMPASPVSVAASVRPASGKAAVRYVNADGNGSKTAAAYDASSQVTLPTPASYDASHTFSAWYLDGATSYAGGASVEASEIAGKVLTAQWAAAHFDVIWKDSDGTVLEEDKGVEYGQSARYDGPAPTKAADAQYTYTFDGWRANNSGSVVEGVVEVVTANIAYWAHYATTLKTLKTYTVTFYSVNTAYGAGTPQAPQQVDYGNRATKPADPSRSGYVFGGWYSDSALKTAYDFSAAVTDNVNLYAKWATVAESYSVLSWADSSDADLKALFDAYYAGRVTKDKITSAAGFQVGAVRSVKLTDGQTVQFRIMDANSSGKYTSGGKNALFIVQTVNSLNNKHAMKSSNTNEGGWPATEMRTYLNSKYSADGDGGVYGKLLPEGFKAMVRQVSVGSAKSGTDTSQVTSSDYLFLPACSEVFGYESGKTSYNGEAYPQWAWYVDSGNSKVKNVGSSAFRWWLRSPDSGTADSFVEVGNGGGNQGIKFSLTASPAIGVAPCGCI